MKSPLPGAGHAVSLPFSGAEYIDKDDYFPRLAFYIPFLIEIIPIISRTLDNIDRKPLALLR